MLGTVPPTACLMDGPVTLTISKTAVEIYNDVLSTPSIHAREFPAKIAAAGFPAQQH